MTISERIFQIMEQKNISQLEFSRKSGIPQSTVSDWKRKKTNPAADKLIIISDVLQVSLYELLSGSQDSKYKKVDYVVIDKNSEEYQLITNYREMDVKAKARMFGYMQALREK